MNYSQLSKELQNLSTAEISMLLQKSLGDGRVREILDLWDSPDQYLDRQTVKIGPTENASGEGVVRMIGQYSSPQPQEGIALQYEMFSRIFNDFDRKQSEKLDNLGKSLNKALLGVTYLLKKAEETREADRLEDFYEENPDAIYEDDHRGDKSPTEEFPGFFGPEYNEKPKSRVSLNSELNQLISQIQRITKADVEEEDEKEKREKEMKKAINRKITEVMMRAVKSNNIEVFEKAEHLRTVLRKAEEEKTGEIPREDHINTNQADMSARRAYNEDGGAKSDPMNRSNVGTVQAKAETDKANPYHDTHGKFSPKEGGSDEKEEEKEELKKSIARMSKQLMELNEAIESAPRGRSNVVSLTKSVPTDVIAKARTNMVEGAITPDQFDQVVEIANSIKEGDWSENLIQERLKKSPVVVRKYFEVV